jgi:hypothetical protein
MVPLVAVCISFDEEEEYALIGLTIVTVVGEAPQTSQTVTTDVQLLGYEGLTVLLAVGHTVVV